MACGRGGVAVWLARRGLAVDAVDVSPVGLAAGARLAAAAGVAGRIRWIAHDLDAGLPAGCRGPYDVVVCQLFRDPRRYADLVAALAPGGLLAITVLSEVDAEPGPFRAPPGELRAAFRGLETLLDRERDGEATPARPPTSACLAVASRSRHATSAATAVVTGTDATSPMLPTSVLTISVATSWLVATSPRLLPGEAEQQQQRQRRPGVGEHEGVRPPTRRGRGRSAWRTGTAPARPAAGWRGAAPTPRWSG